MTTRNPATMERAYSKFEVKTVDAARRLISGIATTPNPDRMADIVEPLGADYDLPLPFLWQHDSAQPVGNVVRASVSAAGISVEVQLAQIDEPGVLQDRLEEAWQSIQIGLVRGLSIGFAPIEYSIIQETGGLRFTKWSWLELSAVTIPANADASISSIKRFDSKALNALGKGRLPVTLGGRSQRGGIPLIGRPQMGQKSGVRLIRGGSIRLIRG